MLMHLRMVWAVPYIISSKASSENRKTLPQFHLEYLALKWAVRDHLNVTFTMSNTVMFLLIIIFTLCNARNKIKFNWSTLNK